MYHFNTDITKSVHFAHFLAMFYFGGSAQNLLTTHKHTHKQSHVWRQARCLKIEKKPLQSSHQNQLIFHWLETPTRGHHTEKIYTGRGGHLTYFLNRGTDNVEYFYKFYLPCKFLTKLISHRS